MVRAMPPTMPPEYAEREHTYFKHRVLSEYLIRYGIKLGSLARGRRVRLVYCDVFAGPWRSRDQDRRDTSVYLGLTAMREARQHWRKKGVDFALAAAFVEKDPASFADLKELCGEFSADFDELRPLLGRFDERAAEVHSIIGSDPAFILVDPLGWKDAGMQHVELLSSRPRRDVMIRVPAHAQRFHKRLLRFLGRRDEDIPAGMAQEELIEVYCDHLRRYCGLNYAAEIAVPRGDQEALACWLVVGGRHPQVLNVFRDVERKVLGSEALDIREEKRQGDQLSFFAPSETRRFDSFYEKRWRESLAVIPDEVVDLLRERGRIAYRDLWPRMLERHHVVERELARIVKAMVPERVRVPNLNRERAIKDHHILTPAPQPREARRAPEAEGGRIAS